MKLVIVGRFSKDPILLCMYGIIDWFLSTVNNGTIAENNSSTWTVLRTKLI